MCEGIYAGGHFLYSGGGAASFHAEVTSLTIIPLIVFPDFKNVSIVGHYIKDMTRDAQFIIISLRNNMFELADRLVGIYKTDNATKTVTINPAEFTVGAGATQQQQQTAQGEEVARQEDTQMVPAVTPAVAVV